MKYPESRLRELLEQYLRGELPEGEQPEFWGYVEDPLFADQLKGLLGESFTGENERADLDATRQRAMLDAIFEAESTLGTDFRARTPVRALAPTTTVSRREKRWSRFAAVAASLLFLLGFALYFYQQRVEHRSPFAVTSEDIAPGRYTATLTLSDGSQIRLSDKTGDIAAESGIRITQTSEGELVYRIEEERPSVPAGWNTLTTQNGESYQVRLPDGSTVWLNSGTSLSYPTNFAAADQRRIELQGEAYFDVARDESKPFRVQTPQQTIEVLGTQFNVNSYAASALIPDASPLPTVTTLVEGSVRVYVPGQTRGSGQVLAENSIVLQPGEQALGRNGQLQVQRGVDLEEITSWKDGYFKFNENLEGILTKVARWYDIEVEYQYRPPASLTFSGKISRDKPLSDLLKIISYNGDVHFRIEGRRVIVMP